MAGSTFGASVIVIGRFATALSSPRSRPISNKAGAAFQTGPPLTCTSSRSPDEHRHKRAANVCPEQPARVRGFCQIDSLGTCPAWAVADVDRASAASLETRPGQLGQLQWRISGASSPCSRV